MKATWKTGTAAVAAVAVVAAAAAAVAHAPRNAASGAAGAVSAAGAGFDGRNAGRALAPLGSDARCAAYSGLPAGWRKEATAGMVHLGAGEFMLGSRLGYPDERPAGDGRTRVRGFWIDQTPVTVAQFAAFVADTGYVTEAEEQGGAAVFRIPTSTELEARPLAWWKWVEGASWRQPRGPGNDTARQDNLPVTLVTQRDALAYARWLGRDLPTEAEWEYAGKAGREGAALDEAPRDRAGKPSANYWQGVFPVLDSGEDGHRGPSPVGCYAANDWRLYDMIGNVWEWTREVYSGPHQPHLNGDTALVAGPARRPASGGAPKAMVIKGGSFLCARDYCVRYRAASRERQEADLAASHIGFRTVLRD